MFFNRVINHRCKFDFTENQNIKLGNNIGLIEKKI